MDYWQLRDLVKEIVPRHRRLLRPESAGRSLVREKGRKKNYSQFDLLSGQMERRERLLNTEGLKSFVEVSCRATECPMPLNLDVWDGFACPFRCRYCVPGDTKIAMADGSEKAISEISKGDEVLCRNEVSGDVGGRPVTAVMSRKAPVVTVRAGGRSLRLTANHEVFTQRGWIPAGDLVAGDRVLLLERGP